MRQMSWCYLFKEPGLRIFPILFSHGFILGSHFIEDLSEVHSRDGVHFYIDLTWTTCLETLEFLRTATETEKT